MCIRDRRYAVRVKVVGDGAITPRGDRIEVRGARTVTLLVAAAAKSFARLRAAHLAAHRKLFRRLSLRIGSSAGADAAAAAPTNERIAAVEARPDGALAALYVQYGRYLLMSSSRPGSQPANLQGLWNEGTNPPWGSKYTINILSLIHI